MADLTDAPVSELLEKPNHAVLSTINKDGSVHNAVVWLSMSTEDGKVAVNTARGRKWPTNLERDPRANLLVINQDNPYEYVEIAGGAARRRAATSTSTRSRRSTSTRTSTRGAPRARSA